jgi:hypothetical protein
MSTHTTKAEEYKAQLSARTDEQETVNPLWESFDNGNVDVSYHDGEIILTFADGSSHHYESDSTTTKLRQTALDSVSGNGIISAHRDMEPGNAKLYVTRNGHLFWREHCDENEVAIDEQAGGTSIQSLPYITSVGTGSNSGYDADIIEEAIAGMDLDYVEDEMREEIEAIPVGYFDDEVPA